MAAKFMRHKMVVNRMNFLDSPVVWFSTMEIEAGRGNFEKAAAAKKELERLGVFVKFRGDILRRYNRLEIEAAK
jgi:hypothetical protein